jgi:predicted transcriptional regulator
MLQIDDSLPAIDATSPPSTAAGDEQDVDGRRSAVAKWGLALDGGFQILPDLILRCQAELKLTNGDIIVLMHLMMAWWDVDRPPFPRTSNIARRMGASERTVQRSINRIDKLRLVRKSRVKDSKGEWRQAFDLTPLTNRLKEIASTDLITARRRKLRTETGGVQTHLSAQAQ